MLLQREKACFIIIFVIKHAFFDILPFLGKIPIAENTVYCLSAASYLICRMVVHRRRKTRLEKSFLGSGEIEQFQTMRSR